MICFLDMDGVLVDFHKGVHQIFGVPYKYNNSLRRYDFWKRWPKEFGVSRQEVDAISTIDFFAGLRWMPDGKEILQLVEEKFGLENIYLLSAVMQNPQSFTGRMMWIERHVPQYKEKTWLGQIPKKLLARPDTILIDDNEDNIEEFAAAGGKYSLIARPWNYRYHCQTIPALKKDLEGINVQSSCNR